MFHGAVPSAGSRWINRAGALLLLVAGATAASAATAQRPVAPVVDLVRVEGVIGPAMARYVQRALSEADRTRAQALLIELDTPGGLSKSMDDITKAMLNSPVPSVVYVYPSGSRAASAGVFIMYAATVAAMAPTTHLGAAHPVGMGGANVDKTEMTKVTNDAVAQIRGFAIRHRRNATWAEAAVQKSVSITDEEALHLRVIDTVANSPRELLNEIDGRQVQTATGLRRLQVRKASLVEIPMDFAEQFLLLLSDPNLGFILMTIAIYGIIFELSNPGSVFPGVIGGLALILACASLAVLSVNVAGLLLIGFAVVLFVADINVPSHGVLTTGGIASFILGSVLLTGQQPPFLRISLTLILAVAALTAAFFLFAVGAGIRAQRRTVRTGREALVDALGVARSDLAPSGTVFVNGELWRAQAAGAPIPTGRQVRVVQVEGLHLTVRSAEEAKPKEGVS